jgi:hypothetical protein
MLWGSTAPEVLEVCLRERRCRACRRFDKQKPTACLPYELPVQQALPRGNYAKKK